MSKYKAVDYGDYAAIVEDGCDLSIEEVADLLNKQAECLDKLAALLGVPIEGIGEKVEAYQNALSQIEAWQSHTLELAVERGSNGVRDFYRQIAKEALAAGEAGNG